MTRTHRALVAVTAILTGLLLGAGALLLISYLDHRRATDHHLAQLATETARLAQDSKQAAEHNTRIGAVILAVTGCTIEDTPAECSARVRSGSQAEGARRVAEVDCAARRLAAGLPALDPRRSCAEQTPVDVYPGAGSPPR